jgi:curved DNA-binding protein CbpA
MLFGKILKNIITTIKNQMQNNPYEILGVSETDSLDHIEYTYKEFMKLLHPDKANTPMARNLKMGQEEKSEYLMLIRNAYKTIISSRRETKYPDYKMDYSINQESRINMDKSFLEEEDGISFNDKFNKKFNEGLNRDKKAGIVDAFGRGYGDFDTGKNFTDEGKISMPSYSSDIDVEASKIFQRPNMKDNRLVEYLPDSNVFGSIGMDFQELGLTNISNFSMTTTGKGGLGGTDLMSVYGNNYEPWEKTIMRDPKLSAKFSDEGDVNKRMVRMEQDRGSIYDLPIDNKMMEQERARNFATEQQEKIRMANKSYRDEYYNELNKGRLNDGVPPRNIKNQIQPQIQRTSMIEMPMRQMVQIQTKQQQLPPMQMVQIPPPNNQMQYQQQHQYQMPVQKQNLDKWNK